MTVDGRPNPARPDAPATPDNHRPPTSELEAVVRRIVDEQITKRITPLTSRIERLETQKMLRDTDVEWNTQRLDRAEWRIYTFELGCNHRDRDVA